jgi:hypothetical protein
MTRKDYQAVADAIAKVRNDRKAPNGGLLPLEVRHTIEEIEDAIADVFARDNDRFDRDRFIQACTVQV